MPDTTTTRGALLLMRAQTELHPGGGEPFGTVDLAIQREVHTKWPMIQGSGIKGVLREAFREAIASNGSDRKKANEDEQLTRIFGKPKPGRDLEPGVLLVTDATLLAFPVASGRGTFAWVTSAGAVERLHRSLDLAGIATKPAALSPIRDDSQARPAKGAEEICLADHVVLRDLDLNKIEDKGEVAELAAWITQHFPHFEFRFTPTGGLFDPQSRLVQVSEAAFQFLVRFGTHIVTRNALDVDTRTVTQGALFTQEYLPAETLFYSVLLDNGRREEVTALTELERCLANGWIQLGADTSLGKGFVWASLDREAAES